MGTVSNDSCLEKIRAREGVCAVCGVPVEKHGFKDEWGHAYIDAGDEPIFVLRAQDVTTVITVQYWLKHNPDLPAAKREEALALIDKVLVWPKKKEAD